MNGVFVWLRFQISGNFVANQSSVAPWVPSFGVTRITTTVLAKVVCCGLLTCTDVPKVIFKLFVCALHYSSEMFLTYTFSTQLFL